MKRNDETSSATHYKRSITRTVLVKRGEAGAPPDAIQIVQKSLAFRGLKPAEAYAAHCADEAGLPHDAAAARSWRHAVVLALIRPYSGSDPVPAAGKTSAG